MVIGGLMSYQMEQLFNMAFDYSRVRGIAYLCRHRELLDDKHYNCAYRILRSGHIKKYSRFTVEEAIKFAEADIEEILENYDKENIEEYKKDVEYIVELSKRFGIADKLDETDIIEY